MNLKGKSAIVTGGTRGIGWAISSLLAELGANVVVSATKQEVCDEKAKELTTTFNTQCIGVQTDVSKEDSVQNLIKVTVETFGKVDILVNNAGITKDNLMLRMSFDDWKAVLDTNLNSVYLTVKSAMKPMLKQKSGRIINISSVVGLMGNPGQSNYAAAKAGIIGLTKSIAKEIGAKGITCNAIAPGFVETEMIKSLPEDYLNNIIANVPLRRLGVPRDIAYAVAFLASDWGSYITGQTITVDGGTYI